MTDPIDDAIPRGTAVSPLPATVHFDGASIETPTGRVAGYGFTIQAEGLEHEEFGLAVPPGHERATNNVAEYVGAIRALEFLVGRGYHGTVVVVGDSQLVVRQFSGEYDVKAEHLRPYRDHLAALANRLGEVRFVWVPREENTRADALSKKAIEEARRDAELRRRLEGRKDAAAGAGPDR